ncbi:MULTISPECIES: transporter [unclassified Synechococcus]|uniref:transporter n=2 Tax=Synechococcales TaxID=1890424 RepID=UPI001623CF64|nr:MULTISPECIES: transporter [unclassified Synechococcus]
MTIDDGIVYPEFNIDTTVLTPTFVHFTDLAGQSAQVSIGVPFVWANAELDTGSQKFRQDASGPGDLYMHLTVGLVNAPSLELPDYAKFMVESNPPVVMYGLAAMMPPTGKYDGDKVINIGTNRWTFRAGLPTTIRLSRDWTPGKTTTLEILPSVDIYTPNNSPPLSSILIPTDLEGGTIRLGDTELVPNQTTQAPMFTLEAHLTHDITDKVWVSLDSLSRIGGETSNDGESQGNQQASTSLGGTLGVTPWDGGRLTVSGGTVIGRNDFGADGWQVMVQMQHVF